MFFVFEGNDSSLICPRCHGMGNILKSFQKRQWETCYCFGGALTKGQEPIKTHAKESDKKTFEEKEIQIIGNEFPSMAHVMAHVGIFKSVSEARKNGWNKPIENGKVLFKKRGITVNIV